MAKFPWAALIAFIILLAMAFIGFQIGDYGLTNAATDTLEQQNETLIVSYTEDVHVSVSPNNDRYTQGFNDSETITNSTNVTLVEGTDYDWNTTDGGVTFFDTQNTTSGEQVNITYFYDYNVEEVRQSEPILHIVLDSVPLFILLPLILFVAGVLVWLALLIKNAMKNTSQFGAMGR